MTLDSNLLKINLLLFFSICCLGRLKAQPFQQALHRDSDKIVGWAEKITLYRGWIDTRDTLLGKASVGSEADALGKADGRVVSLGESGEAIIELNTPLYDGNGVDFVVFENGFQVQGDDENGVFLEVAAVLVSSDGEHYVGFPITYTGPTNRQQESFDAGQSFWYHHLAGHVPAPYGTGFDLADLPAHPLLDKENIRYIKIRDIVGNILDTFCYKDVKNQCVNDPWPTPFASSGFDLDAVGFIHIRSVDATTRKHISYGSQIIPPIVFVGSLYELFMEGVLEVHLVLADGKKFLLPKVGIRTFNVPAVTHGVGILYVKTYSDVFVQKVLLVAP